MQDVGNGGASLATCIVYMPLSTTLGCIDSALEATISRMPYITFWPRIVRAGVAIHSVTCA
jgi:hypothetical protein